MRYKVVTDFPRFPEVMQMLVKAREAEYKPIPQELLNTMDWSTPLNSLPSIYNQPRDFKTQPQKPKISERDLLLGICESYVDNDDGGYKRKSDEKSTKGMTDAQIHAKFVAEANFMDGGFVNSNSGRSRSFIEEIQMQNQHTSKSTNKPQLLFG